MSVHPACASRSVGSSLAVADSNQVSVTGLGRSVKFSVRVQTWQQLLHPGLRSVSKQPCALSQTDSGEFVCVGRCFPVEQEPKNIFYFFLSL